MEHSEAIGAEVECFLDGRVLGKEPSKLGLFGIFIALLPVIGVVHALATVGTIAPATP